MPVTPHAQMSEPEPMVKCIFCREDMPFSHVEWISGIWPICRTHIEHLLRNDDEVDNPSR